MQAAAPRILLPAEDDAPAAAAEFAGAGGRRSRKLEGTESKRHRHHHHRDNQKEEEEEEEEEQQQSGLHNMSLSDAAPHGGADGPNKSKKHFEEWDWKQVMFAALPLARVKRRWLVRRVNDDVT